MCDDHSATWHFYSVSILCIYDAEYDITVYESPGTRVAYKHVNIQSSTMYVDNSIWIYNVCTNLILLNDVSTEMFIEIRVFLYYP